MALTLGQRTICDLRHGWRAACLSALPRRGETSAAAPRSVGNTSRWIPPMSTLSHSLARGVLAASIARYKEQLIWGCDPILPADGFYRLQRGLVSSGFIRRAVDYEACVDNTLAQRVIAERAGG